jgi:hypothetical protein
MNKKSQNETKLVFFIYVLAYNISLREFEFAVGKQEAEI